MAGSGEGDGLPGTGPQARAGQGGARVPRVAAWLDAPPLALRLGAGGAIVVLMANLLYHGHQPYAVGLFRPPFDKLAHVALFMTMGTLLWLAAGARRAAVVLFLALLLGSVDEAMQSFSPGRSLDWTDLLADVVGAALGVFACCWIVRMLRARTPG